MFEVDSIYKSYGKKQVLSDVSFTISPGECIGLLGINGSGKSTLLNILAGGIKADSGHFGFIENKGCLSFLPQENPLIEELSSIDNIKLWFQGKTRDILNETNQTLFSSLGIDTFLSKKVKDLSGGMKKRLSLAITMMSQPDLLLLDEPIAALDLLCKNGILTYLKSYLKAGGSILVATHETAALDICTSIYTLKNGGIKLITEDTTKKPLHTFTEQDYTEILM